MSSLSSLPHHPLFSSTPGALGALSALSTFAAGTTAGSNGGLPYFPPSRPATAAASLYSSENTPLFGSEFSSRLLGAKRLSEDALYAGDALSKRLRVDSAPNLPVYPQRLGEKDCPFYMKTRTCSFGPSCRFDHPTWVPSGGIPDWNEVQLPVPASSSVPLPVRHGEVDCAFYMKTGMCKFGTKCKFNHPKDRSTEHKGSEQNVTVLGNGKGMANGSVTAELKNDKVIASVEGGGTMGPLQPAASFNSKGLPIRPGETDCSFYIKAGSCKFGPVCRFNHPDIKPGATSQAQQSVHPAFGSLSGSVGHLSSYPGVLPDFGLSSTGSVLGISTMAAQGLSLASGSPSFPQRPGEKDCPFFMKTGNCKYGSACVFHHPLSRLNPSFVDPGVKLTLAGLPRREGEVACAYYMKTGTCKYGSACKYDHPPPGEAAAKAVAEASKNEQNIISEGDEAGNLKLDKNSKS